MFYSHNPLIADKNLDRIAVYAKAFKFKGVHLQSISTTGNVF